MMKNKKILLMLIAFSIIMSYMTYKVYDLKIKYVTSINNTQRYDNKIIDLSYFYSGDKMQKPRNISQITGITIHHSASTVNNSIRDIYDIQHEKFIKIGICYTFVIRKNGDIVKCHKFDELLSHAPNANNSDISICLDGNFEIENPTEKQIESLKWLVEYIKGTFNITTIRGHQDVPKNATACPGKSLEKIIKTL